MSHNLPPIPRKPASYSPTFLARSYVDGLHEEAYSGISTHANNDISAYPEHPADPYDRDFALDRIQKSGVRLRTGSAGSTDSRYRRPLPTPPGARISIPETNTARGYAQSFYSDRSCDTSPVRNTYADVHPSGQRHANDSKSSFGSPKPLPQLPSSHAIALPHSQSQPSLSITARYEYPQAPTRRDAYGQDPGHNAPSFDTTPQFHSKQTPTEAGQHFPLTNYQSASMHRAYVPDGLESYSPYDSTHHGSTRVLTPVSYNMYADSYDSMQSPPEIAGVQQTQTSHYHKQKFHARHSAPLSSDWSEHARNLSREVFDLSVAESRIRRGSISPLRNHADRGHEYSPTLSEPTMPESLPISTTRLSRHGSSEEMWESTTPGHTFQPRNPASPNYTQYEVQEHIPAAEIYKLTPDMYLPDPTINSTNSSNVTSWSSYEHLGHEFESQINGSLARTLPTTQYMVDSHHEDTLVKSPPATRSRDKYEAYCKDSSTYPHTSSELTRAHATLPTSVSSPLLSGRDVLPRSQTSAVFPETRRQRLPIPHTLTSPGRPAEVKPLVPRGKKVFSSQDFERCVEVWSRKCLFDWAASIAVTNRKEFIDSLEGLFTHTVPTLSALFARKLGSDVLDSYINLSEIVLDHNGDLTFVSAKAAEGVFPILANSGCYSARCHTSPAAWSCYSSRCSRTIQRRTKRTSDKSGKDDEHDWAQFWGLKAGEPPLSEMNKSEIQRQYQIHEAVYSETDYLSDLCVLRDVFRDGLSQLHYPDTDFVQKVFGLVPHLIELSENRLLAALKHRQAEQGPLIQNIGDIFLQWIELARPVYIQYASEMAYADRLMRTHKARSTVIRKWLEWCESDSRTKKLDFSSYHGSPTRRLQRYALLLSDVLKRTSATQSDSEPLRHAIEEIKAVCQVCDTQVRIAQLRISLQDLHEKIIWKVPQKDLALLDPEREIRFRGTLERKSESHTTWQTRDLILLDNYLLCVKDSKDGTQKILSRAPIPIDFLIVDDFEDVLSKSSTTRLLGGTITHSVSPGEQLHKKPMEKLSAIPALSKTDTQGTYESTSVKGTNENLFPFTVRHAGKTDERMTFYAESSFVRSSWITAVRSAKADRWRRVAKKEPFDIVVLADQAFGSCAPRHVDVYKETESLNTVELALQMQHNKAGQQSICLTHVHCATIFKKADGCEATFVGTEDGIYTNYHGNTWSRVLLLSKVTQIAILEDFGVLTVLADRTLMAYTVDDLLNTGHALQQATKKPPQRLSGSKDVGFFEVGVLKERLLVIYKKKENGNSVFKALEPVVGKKLEKKSFFKKTTATDFFRDFDQFFIPAECHGMQYLRSTICIRCSRGFEIMSLDSKQPLSIPDLSGPNMNFLRARIENAKPLGTYRVQDGEFLCCYSECGLFVDKYGVVSRPNTLEWEGRPNHVVLVGNYVVAIGKEFIEVWNVEKRSLRQVITGRDIKLLPCSTAGSNIDMSGRGVVIAMTNPARPGKQLIFEMKLRNVQ